MCKPFQYFTVLFGLSHSYVWADVQLETITVSGTQQSLSEIAQPATVLTSEALKSSSGTTLGGVLESLPGISNSSFGQGVGRPVVRGLSGSRVKMTINGQDSADVSAMSSDHAPMAEIANAKQIEVLYGPATLQFGSGAMGGVVNIVDDNFSEFEFKGVKPDFRIQTSSADQGQALSGSVIAGQGSQVFRVSGFTRSSQDFNAGHLKNNTDGLSNADSTKVANTDTQSQGGSLSANWVSDRYGYTGLALSTLDYEYAVPNPESERATIAPKQIRWDAVSAWHYLTPNIEMWKTQLSVNDYEHAESVDGDAVGFFEQDTYEIKSTLFFNDVFNWEAKVGLHISQQSLGICHDHNGCSSIANYSNDSWNGTQGANFTSFNGYQFAHDTPMPITDTLNSAAFIILNQPWQQGMLEFGARADQRIISSDPSSIRTNARQDKSYYDDQTFNTSTLSAAMTWAYHARQSVSMSLSRSQRAPDAQEMYWNGDHHATFSYQLDNPDLTEETAHTLDVTWKIFQPHYELKLAAYYYDFNDYIYNDLKSITDPFHGQAVYRHEQAPAWLSGYEATLEAPVPGLTPAWTLNMSTDYVRAQLKEGENKNLPRTPPATLTTQINWSKAHWDASGAIKAHAQQNAVAVNESETDAFLTFNAHVGYKVTLSNVPLEIRLKGTNLTNVFGQNHVSYLKEYSPIMGRNITFELASNF